MAMQIKVFVLGLLSNNTYLAINEDDRTCFLVDPSTADSKLTQYIEDNSLKLTAILLTHGHFDHIGGVKHFKDKFGCKVYMHAEDVEFITNPLKIGRKVDVFTPDVLVEDGDELDICAHKIKVYHTSGHSKGGVCYALDNIIFCGDTIFRESYGRTDFRGGDFAQLSASVKRILDLDGNRILLCGHGESTTSDFERKRNPIFGDAY